METNIKLENFSIESLDKILELEKSSFPKDAYSAQKFRNLYAKYPEDFLIARISEDIGGYIIAYRVGNTVEIDSIAVGKKYRRMGIGKTMLESALEKFEKSGVKKASLEVRTENEEALSFYEKLGFSIKKTVNDYFGENEDAYLMERRLV